MSLSDNIDFLSRLPRMSEFTGVPSASPLREVDEFGANPGQLKMWCYVPPDLPPNSPLVVVLHGCTQTAAGFDHGSGWSELAARCRFALLYPEQQRGNNPNLCFNWFDPDKTARGGGEALSIYRMIAAMVRLYRVSASRIYIVGLSAGGAMASSMLAAYPEVFAGGAIIAGLPHGVAGNLREALSAMAVASAHTASDLGGLVREASSHRGLWPRVSVWHGSADRTVNPDNADQIVAQWLDVHGLPAASMSERIVDGHRRQAWSDADGTNIVEKYSIDGMAHGVPLGIAGNKEALGAAGPFMLDAGISSTRHIANFFGLTATPRASMSVPVSPPGEREQIQTKGHFDIAKVMTRALSAFGLK